MNSTAPRPALALVGTVRSRLGEPRDDLADPAALAGWLARHDLACAPDPDEAHLREFRALREAAYRLLEHATNGGAPRTADVELVNRCAARPPVPVALDYGADGPRRVRPPGTADQVVGVLARDLVDLLTGPERHQLHQCEAEVCGTFFVDTSRAGRRRWCSSATCGNRARVAAHRNRATRP
ncbi:CGNR zinc finger domain-containing protein [Saccharothrix sp. DSM 118769]